MFKINFGGHLSFLWGNWYTPVLPLPCPVFYLTLLVTSVLDFKTRVDPVLRRLWTKDSSDSLLSETPSKFLATDSLFHFWCKSGTRTQGFKKWSYSKKLLTFNLSLLFVLRTLIELALFMLKENKQDMH